MTKALIACALLIASCATAPPQASTAAAPPPVAIVSAPVTPPPPPPPPPPDCAEGRPLAARLTLAAGQTGDVPLKHHDLRVTFQGAADVRYDGRTLARSAMFSVLGPGFEKDRSLTLPTRSAYDDTELGLCWRVAGTAAGVVAELFVGREPPRVGLGLLGVGTGGGLGLGTRLGGSGWKSVGRMGLVRQPTSRLTIRVASTSSGLLPPEARRHLIVRATRLRFCYDVSRGAAAGTLRVSLDIHPAGWVRLTEAPAAPTLTARLAECALKTASAMRFGADAVSRQVVYELDFARVVPPPAP